MSRLYGDREASGPEFAMGSIRGFRNWAVDSDGFLLGAVKRKRWSPGRNEATCYGPYGLQFGGRKPTVPVKPPPPEDVRSSSSRDFVFPVGADNVPVWDKRLTGEKAHQRRLEEHHEAMERYRQAQERYEADLRAWEEKQAQHRVPELKCSCGFYALSDPYSNDFSVDRSPGVWGVIEGWGKTLIGESGFRSQYAKILAVVVPRSEPQGNDEGFDFDFGDDPVARIRTRNLVRVLGEDMVGADLFYATNRLPEDLVEKMTTWYPDVAIFPSKKTLLAEFGPDIEPVAG